jgi:hypothetical protein
MLGLTSIQAWKQSKSWLHYVGTLLLRQPNRDLLFPTCSDIEQIWQMSWRKTFYRGGPVFMSALAGLDIALWDLKGESCYAISMDSI